MNDLALNFFAKLFIKKLENDLNQKINELVILYDKKKLIMFINQNEYNITDKEIINKIDLLAKQKAGNIDYDLLRIEYIDNKLKIKLYYSENEQLKILTI